MNWTEWFTWTVDNPTVAGGAAASVAVAVIMLIVIARWLMGALARRLMVGLGLRKKVERENPWATIEDRVSYKLRPSTRKWWTSRRGA